MPIKSFRGKIADGAIDTISLHTNDGSVGYVIKKLQIITDTPGTSDYESLIKVFSIPQTTVTETIDFSDNTLLGVAFQAGNANAPVYPTTEVIVFDNMTFNQDIYITHADIRHGAGSACNYYIELEQIKLDLSENTVATLKDIRNIASQ